MFERDWARACAKDKFTSMLSRENKAGGSGKPDKQAMAEVHDVLKRHYAAFYSMFVFYAMGGNDPYHMPLNAFTSLLDDAGIPDGETLKRSDCDTIFIVCNFQPDRNSPDAAVNDEHAMMRFEALEAVVRLGANAAADANAACAGLFHACHAFFSGCQKETNTVCGSVCPGRPYLSNPTAIAKYGKSQAGGNLSVAVETLFERNLLPRLPPQALLTSNDFRSQRLYTEEVDSLFKQHQVQQLPSSKTVQLTRASSPPFTPPSRLRALPSPSYLPLVQHVCGT